jgi:O-antigen/teichoic acid export membrane protein
VLVGSGLGFGINLLMTPVLARVFSPATFGQFSTIVAVGAAVVGISTLRLEVRAQSEPDDGVAAGQLNLAVICLLVCSSLVTLIAGGAILLGGAASSWWLVGPIVAAGSLQLVGTAVLVRQGKYRWLALANFLQGAGTGTVQAAMGWLRPSLQSLVLGFLVSRAVWLTTLGRSRHPSSPPLRQVWSMTRRYGAVAGTSAGVNSIAGQVLILMTSMLYGNAQVGALAMGLRMLVAPLGVLAQAAASASVGEVGRILRVGGQASAVVRHGMRDLFVVGLLPCGAAMALGPWLAPRVLGDEWADVGVLIACLAPGALFQFAVAPFSQLMNMTRNTRALLLWDITRLVVLIAAFGLPYILGWTLTAAVAAYSIGQIMLYLALRHRVLTAVTGRHGPTTPEVQENTTMTAE